MTEPYRESDDHAPRSTDIVAQLDTSGLGGHDKLSDVTPVFRLAAEQEIVAASDALRDDGEGAENVVLPDRTTPGIDQDDVDDAVEQVHDRAAAIRSGDDPLVRDTDPPIDPPASAPEKVEDFDPRDHSISEVTTHLDNADAAERRRVLAVERSGAGRKTILNYKPSP